MFEDFCSTVTSLNGHTNINFLARLCWASTYGTEDCMIYVFDNLTHCAAYSGPVLFPSMTTKTKIFVDDNKLIFVIKTTTMTKIR